MGTFVELYVIAVHFITFCPKKILHNVSVMYLRFKRTLVPYYFIFKRLVVCHLKKTAIFSNYVTDVLEG